MKRAGGDGGKTARSPTGRKLGGFLKGALGKLLPAAAGIVGGAFGGPLGATAARGITSAATKMFGLELEGLSPEDQEFETARRFVRLAGSATRQAGKTPDPPNPQEAARRAVLLVARRLAPGLLGKGAADELEVPSPPARGPAPHSGRWFRRGHTIILSGV